MMMAEIWVDAENPAEAMSKVGDNIRVGPEVTCIVDDIFAEMDPGTDEVIQDVSADMP